MRLSDIEFFQTWFEDSFASYLEQDSKVNANLQYKREHSYRVRDNCIALANAEKFTQNQTLIATAIGLLHDVGRFAQYAKYRTFKDSITEDHADLGLAILARHSLLDRLSLEEQAAITAAIKSHNKRTISEGVAGEQLLLCKLIRDADKLDILDQIVTFYEEPDRIPELAADEYPPAQECSPEIVCSILAGRQISYSLVKSDIDIKLVRMSWVLDINFPFAMKIVNDKGYLERIACLLPKTNGVEQIYRYIKKRINMESS